ncbi:hypothetical protein [Sorangium sp. So ce1335]|uniref:hypothetical protein n=1 Tax=Sorangium sp. So ce1335 TaxID=3133335 RepID=UPI003F6015AB
MGELDGCAKQTARRAEAMMKVYEHLRAGSRIDLSLSAMQSAYSKCIAAGELISTPPWASWTGSRS